MGYFLSMSWNLNTWGCVLDELGTDEAECSRKVACCRRVAHAVRSLVNVRSMQLECSKVLQKSFLVPVFAYGSETMIWREEKRSRIRVVQMHNLRSAGYQDNGMRQVCGMMKCADERIDEGVL